MATNILAVVDAALYQYDAGNNTWANIDGGLSRMQVYETSESYVFQSQSTSNPSLEPVVAALQLESAYQAQTETFHCFSLNPQLLLGINFPSKEVADQFATIITVCVDNLVNAAGAAPEVPPPTSDSPFDDNPFDAQAHNDAAAQEEEALRKKHEEEERTRLEQEAQLRQAEEARKQAEDLAKLKAQQDAMAKAQQEAMAKAEQDAARRAMEQAQLEQAQAAKQAANPAQSPNAPSNSQFGSTSAPSDDDIAGRPKSMMSGPKLGLKLPAFGPGGPPKLASNPSGTLSSPNSAPTGNPPGPSNLKRAPSGTTPSGPPKNPPPNPVPTSTGATPKTNRPVPPGGTTAPPPSGPPPGPPRSGPSSGPPPTTGAPPPNRWFGLSPGTSNRKSAAPPAMGSVPSNMGGTSSGPSRPTPSTGEPSLAKLSEEIRSLKESQSAIQGQLNEISTLLRALIDKSR